jgi:hypothetical protein
LHLADGDVRQASVKLGAAAELVIFHWGKLLSWSQLLLGVRIGVRGRQLLCDSNVLCNNTSQSCTVKVVAAAWIGQIYGSLARSWSSTALQGRQPRQRNKVKSCLKVHAEKEKCFLQICVVVT